MQNVGISTFRVVEIKLIRKIEASDREVNVHSTEPVFVLLCMPKKDSCTLLYIEQRHAHPCSLIWAYSVRRHMLHYPLIL